ncbi:MAG: efflux RND transporter periplasmic adaptor subunit [Myxococcales bacterium]|nr:efflux RND transporter periplasmic adaptor subunit [Myxococcales bacterium]
MSRLRRRWYLPLVAAFFGLMTWNVGKLLGQPPPTQPNAADRANAARVAAPPPGQVDEREAPGPSGTVAGNGVVEPAQPETRVGAPMPGRVTRIAVAEGAQVEAGAALVEFDQAVEQAALAAAQAEVDGASAQLARTVRGSRGEDVKAALADADSARARAELSRGVAERLAQAGAGGAATGDEVDRARRQAEIDAASARAAEARRLAVVAGSRREDVQVARAQLAAAEARRAQAEATLARLTVRAPIAGEVLQVKYRAGEYYQPGAEPLLVLGDTRSLRVRMDVDERDLAKVAVGDQATFRVIALPGRDFTGTVVKLGHRMGRKNVRTDDPAERNDTKILEVVITVDAPAGLVVGQRVVCYVAGGR